MTEKKMVNKFIADFDEMVEMFEKIEKRPLSLSDLLAHVHTETQVMDTDKIVFTTQDDMVLLCLRREETDEEYQARLELFDFEGKKEKLKKIAKQYDTINRSIIDMVKEDIAVPEALLMQQDHLLEKYETLREELYGSPKCKT